MQALIKSLVWTFVHSLWEGFFAALLVAVIISATGRTKARLRYNLLGMVFMLFLTAVTVTFIIQFRGATPALVNTAAVPEAANPIANILPEALTGGLATDLTTWLDANTVLLLMLWSLFFIMNCVKLIAGLSAVKRLRHNNTHPVGEEWRIKLEQLRETLGIRQAIGLLQSELIKVPVVLGYLKPVILVPVGLITSIPAEQAEAILLHELGHIWRKDYIVNFFQRFVEAIFFFNPAIVWISSLLREEREACCDDIVVARIGQKRNYLNALVSFQEYAVNHKSYALGISNRRQYLLNRVKRIVTNENKKLNLAEKAALLSGVLLFSAFTYISQEKEINTLPVTVPVERFTGLQQSDASLVEKIPAETKTPVTRNVKKKVKLPTKPITDTIPVKEDKTRLSSSPDQKSLPTGDDRKKAAAATEADKVLKEIEQIKNQIGAKKESIGMRKEKLKEQQGKDNKEEQALKSEIEKERAEIEGQRAELNRKRAQLESIKKQDENKKQQDKVKQKEKQKEKENERKEEWKTRKGNEWENRKASEWGNRKGNELKNEIKNENKNEIKHEMKIERKEDLIVEPKLTNPKIKTAKVEYNYRGKLAIEKDKKLFASGKTSLFKTNSGKYEKQERRFKLAQQKKIPAPKPPVGKENLKSPVSPEMKTPPIQQVH
ncbi:MAG TPA: M56 family metallopeptidase [Ferruginibacter sp.]|nr:M56 family metallopeptidase [Ferruginibacter sp.]